MVIMLIVMGVVFFVTSFFALGQIAWIYLDAKERGDRRKGLWALLSVILVIISIPMPIFLPFPLVIYLIVRGNTTKCHNCQQPIKSNFLACPSCGAIQKPQCEACHHVVESSYTYCPHCANRLTKEGV